MRRTLNASTPTRLATTAAIILLAAAAATFLVDKTEGSPDLPPTEITSHPCEGLPSINLAIEQATLMAGREVSRQSSAPSGNCSLTATVRYRDGQSQQSEAVGTCNVQVSSSVATYGTAAQVSLSGSCRQLQVATRIALNSVGARHALSLLPLDAARLAAASGSSVARARIGVYGIAPAGRIVSDVRGSWRHTENSVSLVALTYPTENTTEWLTAGLPVRSTTYSVQPSIEANNYIPWLDTFDDMRLETNVALTMLAGGGYHCSHSYQAYDAAGRAGDIDVIGDAVDVRGECFP